MGEVHSNGRRMAVDAAMNDSPGWANIEREDKFGHAIDQAGNLIHDPRCYFCLNEDDDQQLTYVKVEIEASP
jgi:phage gp29-like protein